MFDEQFDHMQDRQSGSMVHLKEVEDDEITSRNRDDYDTMFNSDVDLRKLIEPQYKYIICS
jgi:hypothetical protein